MKKCAILLILLLAYLAIIGPFTRYLKTRPIEEKMGYIPKYQVLRAASADFKPLVAASLVLKSMFYFGSLTDKAFNKLSQPPDYLSMYGALTTALRLDPYNMDAYYFSQAFLVWDVQKVKEANAMLDYGMKYRTWDFYLPFFAGFNAAYFLKDYAKAAEYYRRAGELSGAELHVSLAGRYMYESGRTDLAIAYLETMARSTKNEAVHKSFATRLKAFQEVRRIEIARDAFIRQKGRLPLSVAELVQTSFLKSMPTDPYGGEFFLDPQVQVRTTSKFSFARMQTNKGEQE